jgi:hypothetical protein
MERKYGGNGYGLARSGYILLAQCQGEPDGQKAKLEVEKTYDERALLSQR